MKLTEMWERFVRALLLLEDPRPVPPPAPKEPPPLPPRKRDSLTGSLKEHLRGPKRPGT